MKKLILTGPTPVVYRVGKGFVPAIYHAERKAEYLRFKHFTRKAKATPEDALAYAARVIWYRQRRAAEKRRRLEAISHPRFGRAA